MPGSKSSTHAGKGQAERRTSRSASVDEADGRGKRAWSLDKDVFFFGPTPAPGKADSEYFDATWPADIDDLGASQWLWSTLEHLGMPMDAVCCLVDLAKASTNRNRPGSLIGAVMNGLLRLRSPGQRDKRARLFRECILQHCHTLQSYEQAYPAADIRTMADMTTVSKYKNMKAFDDADITATENYISLWRKMVPAVMQSDDAVADLILGNTVSSLAGKTPNDLPLKLLEALIAYGLHRIPVTMTTKECHAEQSAFHRQLHKLVQSGLILKESRYAAAGDTEEGSGPSAGSLQTSSEARLALLLAWREYAKESLKQAGLIEQNKDGRFPEMKHDVWKMLDAPLLESSQFFHGLARARLPDATAAQRTKLIESIKLWARGDLAGVRVKMQWTPDVDVILLKNAIEAGNREKNALSEALRELGILASASAVAQRITHLVKQPERPAFDMLRRSAPRWWQGMLLGQGNDEVLSILTKKGFDLEAGQDERASEDLQERYSGTSQELLELDGIMASWLPTRALNQAEFVALVKTDPFGSESIGPSLITKLDQTRLAVVDRHGIRLVQQGLLKL